MDAVAANGAAEVELTAQQQHARPLWDVAVTLHVNAPSAESSVVEAFWDGGGTWKARFCTDEPGDWHWRSLAQPRDPGLHGREGTIRCRRDEAAPDLLRHGAVEVSGDGRSFRHADGEPFFWLADTAWNGALHSREEDWDRYLSTRRSQRFTAVQFVATQWRGAEGDRDGRPAFSPDGRLGVDPAFYRRMDRKVRAVNAHGLVAAPVVLWALVEDDPGRALSEENATRLARYIVARWDAYQLVWLLGGDGRYLATDPERWKRIGRAVFGGGHDRPVTLHPCGQTWVGEEFREEPWYDFIGYQSGHGDSEEHLRWLATGPPAEAWEGSPPLPVVNLEPNYEAHPSYHSGRRFTGHHVRRAAWWSLLVSPTAGLTYGHHAIWPWQEETAPPMGHGTLGPVGPWEEGLETEGIRGMTAVRRFFDEVDWRGLRPAQDLLVEQPGDRDVEQFVAVATAGPSGPVVAYMPVGGPLPLRSEALDAAPQGRWFDPRNGQWSEAVPAQKPRAPDARDWVFVAQEQ